MRSTMWSTSVGLAASMWLLLPSGAAEHLAPTSHAWYYEGDKPGDGVTETQDPAGLTKDGKIEIGGQILRPSDTEAPAGLDAVRFELRDDTYGSTVSGRAVISVPGQGCIGLGPCCVVGVDEVFGAESDWIPVPGDWCWIVLYLRGPDVEVALPDVGVIRTKGVATTGTITGFFA